MTQSEPNNRKKNLIAFSCIVMAALGLVLGILYPKPVADSFSVGTVLGMVSFLLSLGSVKDRGSNVLAMIAFWLSFTAMTIAIIFSSGA